MVVECRCQSNEKKKKKKNKLVGLLLGRRSSKGKCDPSDPRVLVSLGDMKPFTEPLKPPSEAGSCATDNRRNNNIDINSSTMEDVSIMEDVSTLEDVSFMEDVSYEETCIDGSSDEAEQAGRNEGEESLEPGTCTCNMSTIDPTSIPSELTSIPVEPASIAGFPGDDKGEQAEIIDVDRDTPVSETSPQKARRSNSLPRNLSETPSRPRRRLSCEARIRFNEKVNVISIPCADDYSRSTRDLLWLPKKSKDGFSISSDGQMSFS